MSMEVSVKKKLEFIIHFHLLAKLPAKLQEIIMATDDSELELQATTAKLLEPNNSVPSSAATPLNASGSTPSGKLNDYLITLNLSY